MIRDNRDVVATPPAALRLNWDVFLSFRGEDTRRNITSSLYDSLKEQGVRVFRDDVGMSQGDEIAPTLLEAIDDSAAYIVILSKNYANSHWCLDELARIAELKGRLTLPVFYLVDPSHVRRQKGPFEEDFRRHLERFGVEKVDKWREAMGRLGGLSGLVFDGRGEDQLIQRLAKRVLEELRRTPVGIASYPVGLDSRVEKLVRLLDANPKSVQVLGLHGIGGIGKTTLAKALYNKIIARFRHRCFISNVREICKDDGLLSLQNKLLSDLSSHKVPPVTEIETGIARIRQMVYDSPVLIVLDDVDDVCQLNAVVGKREWFSEGSLIIVTTRNKDVLVEHIVNELFEVRELYSSEALHLFSYHALRKEKPTDEYLDLSKQIVSLTGGLPLALEVFGSFLFDKRRIEEWEDALKKLQCIRPHDLQDVLRISFDGLDEEEKCVFLDIACFLVKIGMTREEAIEVLKGCGFNAVTAIASLTAKSLIKISGDNSLWMHDQIRDMGRQIVRDENIVDPGMRSRLWECDEIMAVLKNDKGTRNMQGIILDFRKKNFVEHSAPEVSCWDILQRTRNLASALLYLTKKLGTGFGVGAAREEKVVLSTKPFESMVNLRLLQIRNAKLEGRFRSFPAEVKWLQWRECPLKALPGDYSPGRLAVLDLSDSGIQYVWGCRNKEAENLMVMNLQNCYNLEAVPDLSGCPVLEKLVLENCRQLTRIHKSVGNLGTLVHLNLKRCSNLVEFPSDISGLKQLQSLELSECSRLKELPEGINSMRSLKELLLDKTAISKLPESIYGLTKLEKLILDDCQFLKQLPTSFINLCSLKELSLDGSALEELPDSVGSLSNLEKLSLRWCTSLTCLPESIGNLHSLTEVSLNGSAIQELPASIGSLSYLKELTTGECHFLCKLPDTIGGLASITKLQISNTSITELPDQIGALKMIETLDMMKCLLLRSLPEAIGCMLTLTTVNLFGSKITELPESLGMLENLIFLTLKECRNLCKLPDSIGNLKSLCHLLMEKTSVRELPESFGSLSNLMVLKMGKMPVKSCNTHENLTVLPNSFSNLSLLEELDARAWRISSNIPDDFERLSMLEILDLGYNNFRSLPCSLRGLSHLKRIYLPHCEELSYLPPLPSSLEDVDVSNCFALESISSLSNLESLKLLNLTNCEKVMDIPGIECLKSLKRLFMSGCRACFLAVKRRLSKDCLRNIRSLSMPGSEIPAWFSPGPVIFSERPNRELRAIIISVVVSVGSQVPENLRDELPVVPNIRAQLLNSDKCVYGTTLDLLGVARTEEDQVHLCRFALFHPLVSMLREGYRIEAVRSDPPFLHGVELRKSGIHMVFEDEDDYGANEASLNESQLSLSERLARFYNSVGGAQEL